MSEVSDKIQDIASVDKHKRLEHVEHIYKQLLLNNAENAQALHVLGVIEYQRERYDDSLAFLIRAIAADPQNAQLHNTIGIVYEAIGQLQKAITAYDRAISIQPDCAETHHNMAIALQFQGQYEAAIKSAKRAIQLRPDYAEAYNTLGYIYRKTGRYNEALANFTKAISIKTDYAEAHNQQGVVLNTLGRYNEAIESYSQAISIDPNYAEAHWNKSLALLLTGGFAEGWEEYRWRKNPALNMVTYPHQYQKPLWDGLEYSGKTLLVHYEQGLGDSLQFVRYLPLVKMLGGTVILEVREPLVELLQGFPGVDILVKASFEHKCEMEFDFHVSLMDLPGIFGTVETSIPAEVPYIYADPAKAEAFRKMLDTNMFNVGIVWSGSTSYDRNEIRSCRLSNFVPLASIQGVALYSLQKGDPASQIEQYQSTINVVDLAPHIENFTDTAAAIENMDLVVSVDTSVLHLAGAMGKPVWAVICSAPEWRWQLFRSDSPWYPTMQLFRQQKAGCWEIVFEEIAYRLKNLIADGNHCRLNNKILGGQYYDTSCNTCL